MDEDEADAYVSQREIQRSVDLAQLEAHHAGQRADMLQLHHEASDARSATGTANFMALRDADVALAAVKQSLDDGSRLIGTLVTRLFHHVPTVMSSMTALKAADDARNAALRDRTAIKENNEREAQEEARDLRLLTASQKKEIAQFLNNPY